jgi:hypothetical protein
VLRPGSVESEIAPQKDEREVLVVVRLGGAQGVVKSP